VPNVNVACRLEAPKTGTQSAAACVSSGDDLSNIQQTLRLHVLCNQRPWPAWLKTPYGLARLPWPAASWLTRSFIKAQVPCEGIDQWLI
jgi:hypothetical protein